MYVIANSAVTMSKCAGLWIEGMLQAEVLGIVLLCSWARHFTLQGLSDLHPVVHELISANVMLRGRQGETL